jgi:hypothetical protein
MDRSIDRSSCLRLEAEDSLPSCIFGRKHPYLVTGGEYAHTNYILVMAPFQTSSCSQLACGINDSVLCRPVRSTCALRRSLAACATTHLRPCRQHVRAGRRGVFAPLPSQLRARSVACARSSGLSLLWSAHIHRECMCHPYRALPTCPPVLRLMSDPVAVVCCRRAACLCVRFHSTADVELCSYLAESCWIRCSTPRQSCIRTCCGVFLYLFVLVARSPRVLSLLVCSSRFVDSRASFTVRF